MNKKEMVKEILDKGILISPELLDILNEDTLQAIINSAKTPGQNKLVMESIPEPPKEALKPPLTTSQPTKPVKSEGVEHPETPPKPVKSKGQEQQRPTIVTQQAAKTQDVIPAEQADTISVKASSPQKAEALTPGDFVKYYNNKYNSLREMLLKKTNAVSINKLDGHSTTTVIGMVKELTPKGFIIEDPTGQAEAIISHDIIRSMAITEDDVLAITGNAREGAIFEKGITLPDVPLTHPVGNLDATILLSEKEPATPAPSPNPNPKPNTQEADIICTPESIKVLGNPNGADTTDTTDTTNPTNTKLELANPAWIDVFKGEKTIRLLIYRPENQATLEYAVNLLKKRHLSPSRHSVRSNGDHDPFLIDTVPDIFWIVTKEKGFKAYKGVTVISCGPGSSARVDLGTRKVEFL